MRRLRENSKPIALATILVLAGFGGGYYMGQHKLSGTSSEQTDSTRKNVVTVIREVTLPNGNKEVVTQIIDKSKELSTNLNQVAPPRHVVTVSGTAQVDYRNLQPVYGILLQKTLLADTLKTDRLQGGLGLNTRGELELTLGWSF